MTPEEFSKLDVGDIIQHAEGKQRWMVASKWGSQLNLCMTLDPIQLHYDPEAWNLVYKVPEGKGSRE
jgi:hypothetical protein